MMQNANSVGESRPIKAARKTIIGLIGILLLLTFIVTAVVEDKEDGRPRNIDKPYNIEKDDQIRDNIDDTLRVTTINASARLR